MVVPTVIVHFLVGEGSSLPFCSARTVCFSGGRVASPTVIVRLYVIPSVADVFLLTTNGRPYEKIEQLYVIPSEVEGSFC